MDRPPLLLGLDLGTTRCKALLIDEVGTEVASTSAPTPFRNRGERAEMELPAFRQALEVVLGGIGEARRDVAAVGITGMAESGAPFDQAGRGLAPVIAWYDPRGAETVAVLEDRFGDELRRRIGQPLRTVSSVAKLGWLATQGVAGVHRWLGVPELCLWLLTGVHVTDHSLAARTGCYDVSSRIWWPEVAASLGLADIFPTAHRAGTVLGRVSTAGASWSGLPAGVPVTLAGHDHLAALAGSGAGSGDFGNSVGTAESVVATADELPDIDLALALRVAVTVRPEGDGWALLAGAARAGRVVEVVSAELRRTPAQLDVLVGVGGEDAIDAGDAKELLDAALAGRPVAMPARPPGVIWNGLLRELAARTWEAVDRAASLVGPPSRLIVFGGGSRSVPWLRAKASMRADHDVAVWRSGAGEAAARGAALQAGVAADWWPSTERAPRAELEAMVWGSVGASADPGDGHDGQGDGGAHEREDHEDGG